MLVKCPQCGTKDSNFDAAICKKCGFNKIKYVKKLSNITSAMSEEERKEYIYKDLKMPMKQESVIKKEEREPQKEELSFELKCGWFCVGMGVVGVILAFVMLSAWFIVFSIIVALPGGILIDSEKQKRDKKQNKAQAEYSELEKNYEHAQSDFNSYREEFTEEILKEVNTEITRQKKQKKKEEKKKITAAKHQEMQKYYNQPIIQCPACKKDISSEAEICVHCGYPLQKMLIKEGYRKAETVPTPKKEVRESLPDINSNQLKCPRCGSTSIVPEKRGYDIMWGFLGSERVAYNVCQKCGYRWKPGR